MIDLERITAFLSRMTPEDIQDIDVSAQTLHRLKTYPERLPYAQYRTIETIDRYIEKTAFMEILKENQTNYPERRETIEVGVDIGTCLHLASSDAKMEKTYTSERSTIFTESYEQFYVDVLNGKTRRRAFEKLIRRLRPPIAHNVRQMRDTYKGYYTHYIIGSVYRKPSNPTLNMIVWVLTLEALMGRKKRPYTVTLKSEFKTSIRCPKCQCEDVNNRVGKKFRCQSCQYTHAVDDIVASHNIIHMDMKGLEIHNLHEIPYVSILNPSDAQIERGFGEREECQMMDKIRRRKEETSCM